MLYWDYESTSDTLYCAVDLEYKIAWVRKVDGIPVTLHYVNDFVYAVSDKKPKEGEVYFDTHSKRCDERCLPFELEIYNHCFKLCATNDETVIKEHNILELKAPIPQEESNDGKDAAQGEGVAPCPHGFVTYCETCDAGKEMELLTTSASAVVSDNEKIGELRTKILLLHSAYCKEVPENYFAFPLRFSQQLAEAFANLLTEKDEKISELGERLNEGRHYLMSVQPKDLTVEDALEALGFGRNGLK